MTGTRCGLRHRHRYRRHLHRSRRLRRRDRRGRLHQEPDHLWQLGEAIFDCIRKAALDAREASFVKHGTTLVINALLQRAGAKTALLDHQGLSRRAGDRPRQPHAAVQSALSSRAAADPARAALRGRRAGRGLRAGADAARHRRARRAGRDAAAQRGRGARDQLPQLVPRRPTTSRQAAAELRRLLPGRVRHHRHGTDPRMARVRAHRDRGRQRLCRAAGQPSTSPSSTPSCAAAASRARCC